VSTPLLDVTNLSLGYGKIAAVKEIYLSVLPGQVVCLIGANGAGKTTTLRGLSGLLSPRGGSIRFDGQDIGGQKPYRIARAGLIHVPEGRQVFAEMTIADNLKMGGYLISDRAVMKQRLEYVLELFPRLRQRLPQLAGSLSGGEQQMLAIGRALMAKPRLLLLDEPSLGLAPLISRHIFAAIKKLNQSNGLTVLLVEQNAYQALNAAHRGYVLVNGTITMEGEGRELLTRPEVRDAYLEGAS